MPARSARRPSKAAPVAPSAFARQQSGADAKALILFELQRARVAVRAAIQGLGAGSAARPVAPGRWSPREILLHLVVRDRARLDELDAIRNGTPASWAHLDAEAMAAVNAAHLVPLRDTTWDDAGRLLERTRDELMAALRSVPAEPADVWSGSHPLGATLWELATHDRKHAEQIKHARIAG